MSLLASLVRRLVARLRSLFRGGREDAEAQEELRFHLEMETEKNLRAGMTPREARRQAHVRLGGVDAIREAVRDARGGRPLEDLVRDFGYALRIARRSPGFTAAAVVSLAIPIGFNSAIFTIVDSFLLRPLAVVRPAQLVDVYTSDPNVGRYSTSSYPDYLDLRAENDVFTDMAAHAPMVALTRVNEAARLVMGEAVTGNYFPFLGVRPARGRLLAPDDDRSGRGPRGGDLDRAVGTRLRKRPGRRGTEPRHRDAALSRRRGGAAGIRRHAADTGPRPVDPDDLGRGRDPDRHHDLRELPRRDPLSSAAASAGCSSRGGSGRTSRWRGRPRVSARSWPVWTPPTRSPTKTGRCR